MMEDGGVLVVVGVKVMEGGGVLVVGAWDGEVKAMESGLIQLDILHNLGQ